MLILKTVISIWKNPEECLIIPSSVMEFKDYKYLYKKYSPDIISEHIQTIGKKDKAYSFVTRIEVISEAQFYKEIGVCGNQPQSEIEQIVLGGGSIWIYAESPDGKDINIINTAPNTQIFFKMS